MRSSLRKIIALDMETIFKHMPIFHYAETSDLLLICSEDVGVDVEDAMYEEIDE